MHVCSKVYVDRCLLQDLFPDMQVLKFTSCGSGHSLARSMVWKGSQRSPLFFFQAHALRVKSLRKFGGQLAIRIKYSAHLAKPNNAFHTSPEQTKVLRTSSQPKFYRGGTRRAAATERASRRRDGARVAPPRRSAHRAAVKERFTYNITRIALTRASRRRDRMNIWMTI